jgi:O-antigen/teichoic acid export membrane protein
LLSRRVNIVGMRTKFILDLISVIKSRAAVIIFSFSTSILTARYLGPEGNGVIAALMIYPSLFLSLGSLGIRQSTTYFVGQQKFEIEKIYSATIAIWLFTSVFCLISCYFLIKYFTKGDYPEHLIYLALIAIPFSLYNTYSSGIFLGKQNIKEFNRINWIPAVLNFGFTALLLVVIPLGVSGAMVSSFAGVFILSLFVNGKLQGMLSLNLSFDWGIIKKMLSLGIVYAISLLVINLNYKSDILMLEWLSNSYQIGIYSKGSGIVQYLWEVPMVLSTLIFSKSAGAKDPYNFSKKVCQLLRFAIPIVLIASILLFFISEYVIVLLYGSQFFDSVSVLKVLIPGVLLLTIFKVLNMDMAGKGRPWLSMQAMLPAVILNVLLNYIWIPQHGADGSALASTISYSFAAVLFLLIYSKTVNIPLAQILKFNSEDKKLLISLIKGLRDKSYIKV